MALQGEYEPSPHKWVRDDVEEVESSGGTKGDMRGMPIVVITTKGAKTGKLRKVPVMRVEHDGAYAAVASLGGAPKNPVWYNNLVAHPEVRLQDGPNRYDLVAREITGEERETWWERAVAAFPDYADYQRKTSRTIPVFVLEPPRS
jgi:deazaflavin-dependent oxidoreductase (nitroreductase family)